MTYLPSSALGPRERRDAMAAMAEGVLDVLVIGGGVVGAGAAYDASLRGLRTALIDTGDWASGTSSRSSKLIHGGLRYLEMMDFALVREALLERGRLVERLAPHLVHPVSFLYPLQHRVYERLYVGSGVALYDALASGRRAAARLPHHRHLSRGGALRLAPALRPQSLTGAIRYYDAQVDDARLVNALVRSAAGAGALVASRVRAEDLLTEDGRVVGARLIDVETGESFEVRSRVVVSAAGVWSEEIQQLAGVTDGTHVRASKGVHLLVARDRLDLHTGLILRTARSVLFVIPWGAHWIIGTTDTDYTGDVARPTASSADVDYLLECVNSVLATPLTRDDVIGVYAGLRPLLTGDASSTAKLSREHTVDRPRPGLVVVAGGKYTTYRIMASDAVDLAAADLGGSIPPSTTELRPLVGAAGWRAMWEDRGSAPPGLDAADWEHLLGRHGSLAAEVAALVENDPSLAARLDGSPYLEAEVVYAVTHEGALHLEDVLCRRTHLSIESADQARAVAPRVAALMAPWLEWSDDDVAREIERYRDLVAFETRWSTEEE